jgi:phosphatidate cytidylyltransferase
MLLKRLIVAAVFLPALYLYIMHLSMEFFFFLLIAVSLVALSEFYSMYHVAGLLKYACLFLSVAVLSVSNFAREYLPDVFILSIMVIMVIRLFFKRDPVSSLYDMSPAVIGFLYVPGLILFQGRIREFGPEWIIFLYATVWASDAMAYFLGKGIGGRKLYREVSPNKTVAGAAGSLIGGALGGLLSGVLFVHQLQGTSAVSIGVIIGSISVIGDLIESMFKRDAGVKDSGIIFPGHGGILDKMDGSLFAGPILYWILIFVHGK